MRIVDSQTRAALRSGLVDYRDAVLFDFSGGPYGYWWGAGNFEYQGVNYIGGGQLLEVGNIERRADGSPDSLTIKLTAPHGSTQDDILRDIDSIEYAHRAVVIYRFFFVGRGDRKQMARSPHTLLRGYCDTITKTMTQNSDVLQAQISAQTALLRRAGHRTRSTEDQAQIQATDRFYNYAGETKTRKIKWGRN